MNMKKIAGACLCAAAIVGCVSVDQTRQQLQSKDPAQVKLAEENIIKVVSYQALSSDMPEKYVELVESNELLGKIISCSQDPKTVMAAINKLDPSKPGTPNELLLQMMGQSRDGKMCTLLASKLDFNQPGLSKAILTKHKDVLENVSRIEGGSGTMSAHDAKAATAKNVKVGTFADKVFSKMPEQELKDLVNGGLDYQLKKTAALRLLEVTEDTAVLVEMFDGDLRDVVGDYGQQKAVLKLASMAEKIKDGKVIVKILDVVDNHSLKNYIKAPDERSKLLSQLSEDDVVKYALKAIDRHSVYSWNENKMLPLNDAVAATKAVKNPANIVKVVSAILGKIASYRAQCKDSWSMSWTTGDEAKAKALVQKFPKFDDATTAALICADGTSWSYLIDSVSTAVAYEVVSSGKAQSAELELELVKKLPKEKVDMAIFNGVKYDKAKKAVTAAMPPELKKQAVEAAEKAYAAIVEKANNAAKETFALEGFYLGMSWDDMKIVLAHHFPELEAKEKDDDGLELYVSNQKSAFCFADKEKKIYQFNFGKKMLKKWYKYDVQDYAQWASTYSRENKIDMQYKMVEKEATVYEPDMSRSYTVWFYQHSYQYKHNVKEYRLTYFGDEKDFTVHGGIGGAAIKELAAPKFRYTRGDPGSLRVRIEKD